MVLREARRRQHLTANALAARAGVSTTTIYRIEHGKTTPRPHVVRRLSIALDVDPAEIVEFQRALAPVCLEDMLPRSIDAPGVAGHADGDASDQRRAARTQPDGIGAKAGWVTPRVQPLTRIHPVIRALFRAQNKSC